MKIWNRTAIALALAALPTGAWAQDFDKGQDAWEAGEFDAAFEVWQPLAVAGNPDAQRALGYMYEHGISVEEDDTVAVRLYRSAAMQGNVDAQFRLGFLTSEGIGTPQDFFYGYIWLNIAGANGHVEALKMRDLVLKKLHPTDMLKAQKRADECFDTNYVDCDWQLAAPTS